MIRITVVTITYNAAAVLQRTLDSLLCQDYSHVEHVIVDGASKDQTVKMVEAYQTQVAALHPNWVVKLKSEPDGGLYDAMNKGLERTTGDYVVFMNAGDCFATSDVLSMVANAAAHDPHPAVVYGNTDIVDNEGRFLYKRHLQPPEKLTWKSFRQGMLVCHQSFYARTDIAKANKYDLKYRHSADVKWCIEIMKEAEKRKLALVNTHATLTRYLREGDTTVHHRASLMERFRVMGEEYGWLTTLAMHVWFIIRKVKR